MLYLRLTYLIIYGSQTWQPPLLCHVSRPFPLLLHQPSPPSVRAPFVYLHSPEPLSLTAPPPYSPDTPKCRTLYQRWQRTWGNKTREQGFQEESEQGKEKGKTHREAGSGTELFRKDRLVSFPSQPLGPWEQRNDKDRWNELMNEWMNKQMSGRRKDDPETEDKRRLPLVASLLATRDEPQCGVYVYIYLSTYTYIYIKYNKV